MKKQEIKNIQPGSKVYIWGNKEKPQKVIWRGLGTLGNGSSRYIRFETGMYFSLDDPSQIEFAPDDCVTEKPSGEYIPTLIQNGFSKTDFFYVMVPADNYFNERNFYFHQNGIISEYGCYVTYNREFIDRSKQIQDLKH